MTVEKQESAETQNTDYKVEKSLLHAETSAEAMNSLMEEAVNAKEKFYPQYWYCSDLIVRYAKDARASLQNGNFAENYTTAMETIARLNQGLDQILKLSAGKFPEALSTGLGLAPALQARLKTMAPKDLVPTLMGAGLSNPERIGWISLFVMMKESSSKSPEEAEGITLPLERSLNDYLKRTDIPLLVADFDKFSNRL